METYRSRRINEIPHQITQLKKQRDYCAKRCWFSKAAQTQTQIDKLQDEFKELYNSYGKEEENEKVQD